jgi:hypothetical protein
VEKIPEDEHIPLLQDRPLATSCEKFVRSDQERRTKIRTGREKKIQKERDDGKTNYAD